MATVAAFTLIYIAKEIHVMAETEKQAADRLAADVPKLISALTDLRTALAAAIASTNDPATASELSAAADAVEAALGPVPTPST